jgi:hypothetical protein
MLVSPKEDSAPKKDLDCWVFNSARTLKTA